MNNLVYFSAVVLFYVLMNTEALQCHHCRYFEGFPVPRAMRSVADESCKNGSIPYDRFLKPCRPPYNETMEILCSKVSIEGLDIYDSVQIDLTIRSCIEFPVGLFHGCTDWTVYEILNSTDMPRNLQRLMLRMSANTTIRICNCNEDGCDVEPAFCHSTSFQCESTRKCLPLEQRCDGINDCGNGDSSDELNCDTWTCPSTHFQCSTLKKCIPLENRCNGDNNCGSEDASDEQNCVSCSVGKFACKTTDKCIPSHFVCDRDNDCGDNSDEIDCQ